ncbi:MULTISPECIES: hypothetical protein [unclassified Pseudomonas]|uniref:hypothetical protein n=1 Tax=unclassified Pseudomonas TaxID=196821 RepID=UPI00119E307F|nr:MULTISPECIES: hypothetical protein [unclassified Pseudomonas]TWC27697.1 hypothetical protein FBY05_101562 [Pseudomonas sp. SJZ083]TWC53963.1 hypothetical protein FBY01_101154 [Pseudomonas sp. SJZ077]
MSSTIHQSVKDAADTDYTAERRRGHAVAVALELIASKASSAEGMSLVRELDHLSSYADKIQEALKVK